MKNSDHYRGKKEIDVVMLQLITKVVLAFWGLTKFIRNNYYCLNAFSTFVIFGARAT